MGLNETIFEVLESLLNGKPMIFLQFIDLKKNHLKQLGSSYNAFIINKLWQVQLDSVPNMNIHFTKCETK